MRFHILILILFAKFGLFQASSKFRISYGSCFSHKYINIDSLIFDSVAADKPDCWVWLGDAVYADTLNFSSKKYHVEPNNDLIEERFSEVINDHYYQQVANSTKIYGVWDDHDYGLDNGGKSNPIKHYIRKLYLDFLKEDESSPRRTRNSGMYESYFLDPENKIKLILLDNRWNLDEEWSTIPVEERTTLGAEQEKWMREEIMNSTAHFTLVAAGIQMLPNDRDQEHFYKSSLISILSATNPKTQLILLSGDVHYGEILTDPCTEHLQGYVLKEYTSSGLSHSEAEHPYYGKIFYYKNMYLVPPRYNRDEDRWMNRNYAIMDFELGETRETSKMQFYLKDVNGKVILYDTLDRNYFRTAKSSPNIAAYEECKKDQLEMFPLDKVLLWRLKDVNHPLTQAIYGLILLIVASALLCCWCCLRCCRFMINSSEKQTAMGNKKNK